MSKTFNLEEYDTIVINDLSLNGSFLTNFQVGVPIGTILPWQDINTIPDGWKLCDGNGTYTDISGITRQIPDLRSKFIIGHDTRDTSFNIDTSGSSFVYRESDSDPDKPRNVFVLGEVNDEPLSSSNMYKNVYYSLAYIIRVSNPNISTDTAGDKIINGDLTATGKLIANGDLSANENVYVSNNLGIGGDLSANGNLYVSNNVGIGTSSPQRGIHIHSSSNNSGIQFTTSGTGSDLEDGARITMSNTEFNLINREDGNMRFWTHGSERVRIDSDGNVGIGTTDPKRHLTIYASSYPTLQLAHSSSGTEIENGFELYQGGSSTEIVNYENCSMNFWTNATRRITIQNNGTVGIGINAASPEGMLHVNGAVTKSITGRYFVSNGIQGNTTQDRPLSIYMNRMIATEQLHIFSDERIKKNITDVPDNLSLQMIRDLPIRYYNYIDEVSKGTNNVIGFIAQEVKEILPNAVGTGPDYIPDEYRALDGFTWEPTNDNKYKLLCNITDCSGVDYYFKVGDDLNEEITDVYVTGNSDNSFTFDKTYQYVFCFGKKVNDFHTIDKNQIFAVGMSALQEVDRQLQAEKAKTTNLETQVVTLESENATLKTQVTDILQRLSNANL